jgi:hypothetical protein
LPALQPWGDLGLGVGDVLIHAPGFEDRTMASSRLIHLGPGASAILVAYLPERSDNRLNEVRRALTGDGTDIESVGIVPYDRFRPDGFERRLRDRLTERSARRAFLDISTMSKLTIILALNVCLELGLSVVVVYAEAKEYGPSQPEFECAKADNKIHQPSLRVYSGVYGVVRADSLKSVAMQGCPTAALVFMSFNDALTQVLLNTVYPSRLFLINGRPPKHTWREEATAWIHEQVRREWDHDNPLAASPFPGAPSLPRRSASTLDYRETVVLLLDLYWSLSATHRLLLAPAGSKMQAVGCFFVKALHPDIHIEYPSPEGFLTTYSTGIGKTWRIDFGDLSALLSMAADIERRERLEIVLSSGAP